MALRQAAAGFMETERGFRRIRGYRELPFLQNFLTSLTKHVFNLMNLKFPKTLIALFY
jgi:hypothetical protein